MQCISQFNGTKRKRVCEEATPGGSPRELPGHGAEAQDTALSVDSRVQKAYDMLPYK